MRAPRILFALLLTGLVGLGGPSIPSARAVYLSTLVDSSGDPIPGATFTVGDLTFSNFSYQPPGGPPALGTEPGAPTISAYTDAFGNIGITIGGAFTQAGVGVDDVRLGYTVTTSGAGFSGISMTGDPSLGTGTQGYVNVTETVSAPGVGQLPGSIVLTESGSTPSNGTLSFNGATYTTLIVQKDIEVAVTGGPGSPPNTPPEATISIIDQSLVVPEPASFVMMGLGVGIGGLVFRRRRAVKV